MKAFPIPLVSAEALCAQLGRNSQPAEEDGFDYLPLPSGMHTFEPPPMPEATDPQATRAAIATLETVLAGVQDWPFGQGAHPLFDLSALEADALAVVNDALGQGEVSAIVRGNPAVHIQETVFAGLWRVQAVDAAGRLISDRLEASPIPAAVRDAATGAIPCTQTCPQPPLIDGVMNAPPVLFELFAAARAHRPGNAAHVVNLSLLPMTPADLTWLSTALGDGPVVILSRGYGNCRITATGLPATWRVQYFNNDDKLILDTVEVTDIPEVALAAAEDFADSRLRLAEWIATLQQGLDNDAHYV